MKLQIAFLKQVNAVLQFIMDTLIDSLPNVCSYSCKSLPEANESVVKLMDNILCVVEKNSYKCLTVKVCKTVSESGNVVYELKFFDEEHNKQTVHFGLPVGKNTLPGPLGLTNLVKNVIGSIKNSITINKADCASVFTE
jgi:hypothetical protein